VKRRRLIAVGLVWVALFGCATNNRRLDRSARMGEPAKVRPDVSAVPVRGFPVVVTSKVPALCVEGELLAVGTDRLYLATEKGLVGVPMRTILHVRLELYPSNALAMAAWSAGGFLSTASHGFFLLLTAPVWLVVGTAVTVHAYAANKRDIEPAEFDKLYQYARFPAGLPPGFVLEK
jgi:hypothetical protein